MTGKMFSHLQSSHSHHLIAVVEEVWQHVEDGRFREDQFLKDQGGKEKAREKTPCSQMTLESVGTVVRFSADLQVLNAELVAVHVDGGEEDGLHLVVSELIGGEVGGDQHLNTERKNLGNMYPFGITSSVRKLGRITNLFIERDQIKWRGAHLPSAQRHLCIGSLAELGEFGQDSHQFICQSGISATKLVLQITGNFILEC